MPRRRDPVPRARSAGHWLAGILALGLLGGGVVSAAVLLWENLDIRQLAPRLGTASSALPTPVFAPQAGHEAGAYKAAILRSPRNADFFPDKDYYPRSLQRWHSLIQATGGTVRDVASLEDVNGVGSDEVLVIPDAPCLSNGELKAVRAHVARGGGIVSNWAVGARDEKCSWRGWNTVADLTGAPDVRELAVRKALFLTVPEGTPLSPGLDPGTRVELISEPSLGLVLKGARVYWSDWALNPAPDESGGGADVAALAYRAPSGARGAWFGFRLSQSATPADSARIDVLVGNGLRWAAGLATASAATWPDGRQAALVVAQNVEADYQNSAATAELLRTRGVEGSFYAVSQLVMDDRKLASTLAAAGEVSCQTSDHQPVAGLSFEDQAVRLRRSWTEIRGWTGVPPAGLRPPEESFDYSTLRAWSDAGGSYVLAVNQSRSGSPELYNVGGRIVVLLPRLIKDDYNVVVQEGKTRSSGLAAAYLDGMDKIRAMGGLAVVASHTQIVGVNGRLQALGTVLDTAGAQKDWWIATGEEVASWWKARSGVHLAIRRSGAPEEGSDSSRKPVKASGQGASSDGSGELEVVVEAPRDGGVAGLWVEIVLPEDPQGLAPLVDGQSVAYVGTPYGIRVPVGDMEAGARRTISLIPAG